MSHLRRTSTPAHGRRARPPRGRPPGCAATVRPSRRVLPRSRWAVAAALAAAAVILAACQGAPAGAMPDAWSEAELSRVFDLAELGRELTIAPSGDHLLLDGRALPPEVLERLPHLTMGRSTNLLRFADDALEAMSPDARDFVMRAAPGELRARLAGYGLGMPDLRAAWGDGGELGLAGLRAVAARLDAGAARVGVAGAAGARLLADLGVAP